MTGTEKRFIVEQSFNGYPSFADTFDEVATFGDSVAAQTFADRLRDLSGDPRLRFTVRPILPIPHDPTADDYTVTRTWEFMVDIDPTTGTFKFINQPETVNESTTAVARKHDDPVLMLDEQDADNRFVLHVNDHPDRFNGIFPLDGADHAFNVLTENPGIAQTVYTLYVTTDNMDIEPQDMKPFFDELSAIMARHTIIS